MQGEKSGRGRRAAGGIRRDAAASHAGRRACSSKVAARRGHLINCQVLSPSEKARRRGALPDINISDSVASGASPHPPLGVRLVPLLRRRLRSRVITGRAAGQVGSCSGSGRRTAVFTGQLSSKKAFSWTLVPEKKMAVNGRRTELPWSCCVRDLVGASSALTMRCQSWLPQPSGSFFCSFFGPERM